MTQTAGRYFLLRRRQEEAATEKEEQPADQEVGVADDNQGSLFGGWEHRDPEGVASPQPSSAPSGDLGAAMAIAAEAPDDGLLGHLRAADMCAVFSPPRVSTGSTKFGIEIGYAMDITTGWGFTKEADRKRASDYVDKEKPLVLIGCPPCVAFSQVQALVPDIDGKTRQLAEGTRHMEFVSKLYKQHADAGRVFLHEQPSCARSWALPCIRNILRESGSSL